MRAEANRFLIGWLERLADRGKGLKHGGCVLRDRRAGGADDCGGGVDPHARAGTAGEVAVIGDQ